MYKKFSAQKEHLGKCKWRVVVVVVRGGGGARQNLRVIRGRAELSLPLLTRGRYVIPLYVSLIFKQDGY